MNFTRRMVEAKELARKDRNYVFLVVDMVKVRNVCVNVVGECLVSNLITSSVSLAP